MKARAPNFPIKVTPVIYEADSVIILLWCWNQRFAWENQFEVMLIVKIARDHHPVAIFVQGRAKCRVSISCRTKYDVEHHEARAGAEKFIHQQRPNFA